MGSPQCSPNPQSGRNCSNSPTLIPTEADMASRSRQNTTSACLVLSAGHKADTLVLLHCGTQADPGLKSLSHPGAEITKAHYQAWLHLHYQIRFRSGPRLAHQGLRGFREL